MARPGLVAFALGALGTGCGGSSANQPEAALAETTDAQRELRELEQAWELATPAKRVELREPLQEFIERYPTDPSVARARLMLARAMVEEGQLDAAEQTLGPVIQGPPGNTHDEAEVLLAVVERRHGNPEAALARLAHLDGKLFSAEARDTLARERIQAALATRRWRLAVDGLVTWLSIDQRHTARDEAWVLGVLAQIPVPALSIVLGTYAKEPPAENEATAREWLERRIIELLSREALAKQDPHLARELLQNAPLWLRTSEVGDELLLLASQAGEAANVAGRVVGIVVGGDTESERRRSVQVVSGMLDALGLGSGSTDELRLIVEEERGSLSGALSALSGQGASLLVAGSNADSALAALRFAEARQIPLLTISAPAVAVDDLHYGFVFGEDEVAQARSLEAALAARGVEKIERVGSLGTSCEPASSRPGVPTFPVSTWSTAHVRGLVVLGDPSCARRLAAELRGLSPRPILALGLEAAEAPQAEFTGLRLGAGKFPDRFEDKASSRASSRERRGEVESLGAPSWFNVLGADMARLAKVALAALPNTTVSAEKEVRARHEALGRALASAEAELISTEARGFAGKHRLVRTLEVRQDGEP
jgi:hypothetical protein